jgi:hypothetical protein
VCAGKVVKEKKRKNKKGSDASARESGGDV